MSRVCSEYMLLMAEFVLDLLCTSCMSQVEYLEFVVTMLEILSANSTESLVEMRPKGLRAPRLKI